jgi:hypothetical protein
MVRQTGLVRRIGVLVAVWSIFALWSVAQYPNNSSCPSCVEGGDGRIVSGIGITYTQPDGSWFHLTLWMGVGIVLAYMSFWLVWAGLQRSRISLSE